MNLLQMTQFKVLAQNSNMAKAAEKLFISQPALSKMLRNMENELGCELFDRIGKNIVFNRHGEALLEHINVILNEYDKINEYFNPADKYEKEPLRLYGLDEDILNALLYGFIQKYPSIAIERETTSFEKSLLLLLKNEADVIFTDNLHLDKVSPLLAKENIDSVFLFRNRLFLTVLPDRKLAQRDMINLKEVQNEAFIGLTKNDPIASRFNEFVNYVCEKEQVAIHYVHRYDSKESKKLILNSSYLAFADSLSISYYWSSHKFRKTIPISEESASQDIFLCYRRNNKRAEQLVEHIKRTFYLLFEFDEKEI